MSVTVRDICQRALEHCNVAQTGQPIEAEDADVCIRALASMLDAWQLDPQATVGLQMLTFTPTSGQQVVTFGDDPENPQDISAKMPVSLELSSVYRVNDVDRPIGFANSMDEYAAQSVKSAQGFPRCCYYQRSNDGIGRLYLWPAATGTYELRLQARQDVVSGYESLRLSTTLTLPNGYRDALEKCLAEEVKLTFRVAPVVSAQIQQKAAAALRKLKRAGFVSHQIQNRVANYTGWRFGYDIRTS